MKTEYTGRFKDASWFTEDKINVIIGGAGGISSWLSLLLNRCNFKTIIYDFDTFEVHNIGGQLCKTTDIGKPKVKAIKETIKLFTDEEVIIFNEKYTKDSLVHDYMFSGFDNMEARRVMFNNWKEYIKTLPENSNPIFIDGRLLAQQLQIYCVTNNEQSIKDYENTLVDDSLIPEAPCTLKQTSHCAAMIASHMVGFFTNHISNVLNGDEDCELPFFYEYIIPLNFTNVKVYSK